MYRDTVDFKLKVKVDVPAVPAFLTVKVVTKADTALVASLSMGTQIPLKGIDRDLLEQVAFEWCNALYEKAGYSIPSWLTPPPMPPRDKGI